MYATRSLPITASILLATVSAASAFAQSPAFPYVQMETTAVNVGVGGQSGEGVLRLPNLGTNCEYPFKVSAFGAGIHVGVSKVAASGAVQNMSHVSDLSGDYSVAQGDATILAGGGAMTIKNGRNNVLIDLKSATQGLSLGFGGQGMRIQVADPAVNT
jgi:hypothetical protein